MYILSIGPPNKKYDKQKHKKNIPAPTYWTWIPGGTVLLASPPNSVGVYGIHKKWIEMTNCYFNGT